MATKISELTAAGAITGTETLPVVQSGATVKATVAALGTAIAQTIERPTYTFYGALVASVPSPPYLIRANGQIVWSALSVSTASSSGSIVADIKLNGSTQFSETLAASDTSTATNRSTTVTAGDVLTVELSSIGTGAVDAVVQLQVV